MYIIAEIGINHNGDLDLALQMIKAAKDAGANCVKFQKRNPDKCVPEDQKDKPRTFKGEEMTYLEYKKHIEFGEYEYWKIANYCNEIGIDWTASVWDVDSVKFMEKFKYHIPFIKIPSACITDLELINAVNQLGVPVLMSNGMSTFEEMNNAIKYISDIWGVMHCNSSYPCSHSELDLNFIKTLKFMYPELKIGYSGHEIGYFPSVVAVAAGAEIIERHFTLDNNMEGTDQKASLEPHDFENMVDDIYKTLCVLGNSFMTVYYSEEKVKEKLRK